MVIENLNAGEFFGTAIVLSFLVSFGIVFLDGLGILRDPFKDDKDDEKNFFHHHFHYKDKR